MNILLLISAIMALIAFAIHGIAGEITDIKTLLKTDYPESYKIEVRMVWHAFTIDMLFNAIILFIIAIGDSIQEFEALIIVLSLKFILFGFTCLGVILYTNKSYILKVPQWALLFLLGIICGGALFI